MAEPRRRATYANVMSTIAVVLALGGGTAWAATQIDGKNLINHTVAGKKLVNNTVTGTQVNESSLGTVPKAASATTARGLTTLPSGRSESGVYAGGSGDSTSGWIGVGISFAQPLAAPIPDANVIWVGNGANANCPGPGHAARGFLCLYDAEHSAVTYWGSRQDLLPTSPSAGAIIWFNPTAASSYVAGQWTVTAP